MSDPLPLDDLALHVSPEVAASLAVQLQNASDADRPAILRRFRDAGRGGNWGELQEVPT